MAGYLNLLRLAYLDHLLLGTLTLLFRAAEFTVLQEDFGTVSVICLHDAGDTGSGRRCSAFDSCGTRYGHEFLCKTPLRAR